MLILFVDILYFLFLFNIFVYLFYFVNFTYPRIHKLYTPFSTKKSEELHNLFYPFLPLKL